MMQELMMNEDFADVTLITEDKGQIKANINILSACSSVFKDTLKKEKNSSQIMYLRGIQFSEMESIMQFIYLGEATFFEERMNEFLAVAKSLEIKELYSAEQKINSQPEHEPSTSDFETSTENLNKETILSDHQAEQAEQERGREVFSVKEKLECEPFQKPFSEKGLYHHNFKYTVHHTVNKVDMFVCDQCAL